MLILILEDDNNRIARFMKELSFIGHELHFAETTSSAKKYLSENVYDVIFLDHDLGGEMMVDSDKPNTGYQVAKAIVGTANEDAYIVIHSMNPAGSNNMAAILPKAIVAPFTILNIQACVETDNGR